MAVRPLNTTEPSDKYKNGKGETVKNPMLTFLVWLIILLLSCSFTIIMVLLLLLYKKQYCFSVAMTTRCLFVLPGQR